MRRSALFPILIATLLVACSSTPGSGGQSTAQPADTVSVPAFDADRARSLIAEQCAFGPRVPGTDAHSRCGDWIEAQLRLYADTVITQTADLTTFDGTRLLARNFIAELNPQAEQRVLLVAHWDCRPWADKDPDPAKRRQPVMGANDGASGVAVILEALRCLKSRQRLSVGIDILLTDVEDWGKSDDDSSWALGTQYWAAHQHRDNYRPVHAILLDMVGGEATVFAPEHFSMQAAPATMQAFWEQGIKVNPIVFTRGQGTAVTDDHIPLQRAGIRCIDVIGTNADSPIDFLPQWHTTDDTLDHISTTTLAAVGQALLLFLYSL